MKRSKLYIFDIDGTIITSEHKILASTLKGMALIKEHDGKIMLASARPPRAIDPICDGLGLKPFYISLNGALIIENGKIIWEQSMERKIVQQVIDLAQKIGVSVNVYAGQDWFIRETNFWSTQEGNVVGYYGEIEDLTTVAHAHKLLLIGEVDQVIRLQHMLKEKVPQVLAARSFPNYLEVVAAGVSKARALEKVCDLINVSLDNVVAFGDGENDLPMLQVAGFSVAMGNAHENVKRHADFVSLSNNEDGILLGIKETLGQGGV